jgi:hypothetical protein
MTHGRVTLPLSVMSSPVDLVAWTTGRYVDGMSNLSEIESAVRDLSPEERAAFRQWFAEFDAADWDRSFEADIAAGQLDWLAQEARSDLEQGHCTDR